MLNYYQLLELDPDQTDPVRDAGAIRARIEEKRGDWSSGTSVDGLLAKMYVEQIIPEMLETLQTRPDVWKEHRAAEKERRNQDRARMQARLGSLISRLKARGGSCTDDDAKEVLKQLKNEFREAWLIKEVLGEKPDAARVRDYLKQRGVSFTSGGQAAPPEPTVESLDDATADVIFQKLDFLVQVRTIEVADLYAFLAAVSEHPVGPTYSEGALAQVAAAILEKELQAGRTDAISTIKQELLGQCRTILGDAAKKPRYELSYAMRAMKAFDADLRVAAGKQKVLLPNVQEDIVRDAVKRHIPADIARQYISRFAREAGITLIPVVVRTDVPKCGFCHTEATSEKDTVCVGCGRDLFVKCPNPKCKKTLPTTQRFCSCGYAVGDAPLYAARMKDAEKALAAGDGPKAKELAESVLSGWAGYPPALELIKKVEAEAAKLVQLERDITALLADKRGHAAKEQLDAPGAARLPNRAGLHRRATDLLSAAAAEVAEGRKLQAAGRADDAIDRYEHALRVCADHPDARAAMAACPPDPPTGLDVTVSGATAAIKWKVSAARGTIKYRVVRKTGTAPRSPTDGTAVDTVSGTSLTDADIPIGEAVYYAVYAQRGDAFSTTAAVGPPAFRTADVTGAKAVGRDGCAELAWTAPPKSLAVEVWRRAGAAPTRREEGDRVNVTSPGRAVDLGLTNGRAYGYRLVAVFRGPDGANRYAPGVEVTATPVALPAQVPDLAPARVSEREVEARWKPLKDVTVAVYVTPIKPTHAPGTVLSTAELDTLGRRLDAVSDGHARGKVDPAPVAYFIPVSIVGTTAVLGPFARLSSVPDVAKMEVSYLGGEIVCEWLWPAGVKSVLVAWRADKPPTGPGDPKAKKLECQFFQYNQNGRKFTFAAPRGVAKVYLAIFARAPSEDGVQFSPGGAAARKEIPLRTATKLDYEVKEVKRLGLFASGDYELTITTDKDVALPELVLLARPGEVPLDREDGEEVHRVEVGTQCGPDEEYTVRLSAKNLPRKPKFKLFTADPGDADWLDM